MRIHTRRRNLEKLEPHNQRRHGQAVVLLSNPKSEVLQFRAGDERRVGDELLHLEAVLDT